MKEVSVIINGNVKVFIELAHAIALFLKELGFTPFIYHAKKPRYTKLNFFIKGNKVRIDEKAKNVLIQTEQFENGNMKKYNKNVNTSKWDLILET